MTALSMPSRLVSALLGLVAAAALGACGDNGGAQAPDGFKPVPVTPVLGDVTMGDPNAKVTIVEYASLMCPYCRNFFKQDFPRLKANYIDTGKVKYIYRDYPLHGSIDVLLASVARCGGPDKYYTMIGDIFGAQGDIEDAAPKGTAGPLIDQIAKKNGISHDQARTCIDFQPALKASIQKSNDEAVKRGVHQTPTLYVNDVEVPDHVYDVVSAAIDKALSGAPAAPASASPAGPATPAPASPTPASTTPPTPAPTH
jgi:protein-disulfide isomerase